MKKILILFAVMLLVAPLATANAYSVKGYSGVTFVWAGDGNLDVNSAGLPAGYKADESSFSNAYVLDFNGKAKKGAQISGFTFNDVDDADDVVYFQMNKQNGKFARGKLVFDESAGTWKKAKLNKYDKKNWNSLFAATPASATSAPTITSSINTSAGTIAPSAVTVVPEPATMLLLGAGLIGLAGFSRRKFKKN